MPCSAWSLISSVHPLRTSRARRLTTDGIGSVGVGSPVRMDHCSHTACSDSPAAAAIPAIDIPSENPRSTAHA
jgi:hypothetical protein